MERNLKAITILMADDDPDDRLLTQQALDESRLAHDFYVIEEGGEELMDYLCRRGKYSDANSFPVPGVILLDLNMPKKSGREALQEIKNRKTPEKRRKVGRSTAT